MTLSHTAIEYGLNPDGKTLGYLWPIVTGCLHDRATCATSPTCWARAMVKRNLPGWKAHYNQDFSPRFNADLIGAPGRIRKPSTFLVAFTGDLFSAEMHLVVPQMRVRRILDTVESCPQHRFLFLTKNAPALPAWNPWPPNAWVGMSLTGAETPERQAAMWAALERVEARVRWLSYEPMLGPLAQHMPTWVNWVVMGAQTGKGAKPPQLDWANMVADDCWGTPSKFLWIKTNLARYLNWPTIQELPNMMGFGHYPKAHQPWPTLGQEDDAQEGLDA